MTTKDDDEQPKIKPTLDDVKQTLDEVRGIVGVPAAKLYLSPSQAKWIAESVGCDVGDLDEAGIVVLEDPK